jgi:hypothetical protein
MILHPSGVTCSVGQFLTKTFEFVDVGSGKLLIKGHRDEHVTPLG